MKNFFKTKAFLFSLAIFCLLIALVGSVLYSSRVTKEYIKYLPQQVLTFKATAITKRPDTNNRAIETDKGEEAVYLVSGYRAYYVTTNKLPFLRLHPEKTPPGEFANDKDKINRQFSYLTKNNKHDSFTKKTYKDHEYYLVGNPANEGSGTKEIGSIFFPEDSIILTIYFFNQGDDPSKWDYSSADQYVNLRDNFIKHYIDLVLSH